MIYVISIGEYFKVGYSLDTDKRMKSYSTHNPDYKLEASFSGGPSLEKFIHKGLSEHRLNSTEWFRKFEGYLNCVTCLKNVHSSSKTVSELTLPLKAIKDLSHLSDVKLLIALLEDFGSQGIITLSHRIRKDLAEKTGLSLSNLNKNFKRLATAGLLENFDGDYKILVGAE